jgi:hypothetical protein
MIGDVEVYSGSFRNDGGNYDYHFTNYRNFWNRDMVDKGKGINYHSFINGNPGIQDGRAMGKTRYFYTSSGGDIIYPSNHVSRFPNNFINNQWRGTQNTNPGFWPGGGPTNPNNPDFPVGGVNEDYSTASFYRVEVSDGENQVIVKSNKQVKINTNRFINRK